MGNTFPLSGGGVDAVEGVFGDVAVTCEGEITLFGPAGSRTVRAGDFFTGPLSTLRQPDEIVTELHLRNGRAAGAGHEARLRRDHGRKSSFWSSIDREADRNSLASRLNISARQHD